MKPEKVAVNRYFKDVSRALLCGRAQKRAILTALRENLEEYATEHTDASEETLRAVFGTPDEIAAGALEGEDLQALKRKTNIRRAVLIALALALLIWAGFAALSLIDVHTEAHGYIEEGILRIVRLFIGGMPA